MNGTIAWYRTSLDKHVLRELTATRDARGWLQAGGFLLIYLGTLTLACWCFRHRLWLPLIVVGYLHCLFTGFVGMEAAVHELCHRTPFRTRWLNTFFYNLFCFLSWNNGVHFYASHMKHHQFTLHTGLDKEVVLKPIALNGWDYLQWFTFNFKKFRKLMFPTLAHACGFADVDVFFWDPLFPPGDRRRRSMCTFARLLLAGHLLLLVCFILLGYWPLIVLVTFGGFIANFASQGCGMQQHLGLQSNVPDWRLVCHTVRFGPLMSFLYWQMNYHIEHHMYAAVPFWKLHRLHAAIAHDTPRPVEGYWNGIRAILAIQRRQRLHADYCHVPLLPPGAGGRQQDPV